jgi:hypothetical protein
MTTSSARPVLRAGYGLGLLLTLVPLFEVWLAIRPLRPLQQVWRVSALGQLGDSLMLPVIGAFVLVGTALLLQEQRVLRAFTLVAGTMVLLLSVGLALFVRDGLAFSRSPGAATAGSTLPFTFEKVAIAYGAAILVSAWLCVGTYRVWRRQAAIVRRERQTVMIVRREPGAGQGDDRSAVASAASPSKH